MSSAALAVDIAAQPDTELLVACQQNPAQAARRIAELEKTLEWHRAYENKMHEIVTNKDMSYSDRVLWAVALKNHPEEMMTLRPFQPNIFRLRQESGVSKDTATNFFASMHEARAIKYSNKPNKEEEGDWGSVSTIVPSTNHTQANTKAAARRIKQREEVKKRRVRKLDDTIPCESCGSTDPEYAYANIVPHCRKCGNIALNRLERVSAKSVRIVEEEIIPPSGEGSTPSPEFSETEEWIEDDNDTEILLAREQEETTDHPSPEFSAPAADASGETKSNDSPIGTNMVPSPEFSARASGTPSGFESIDPTTQTNEETATPSPEFSEAPDQTPDGTESTDPVTQAKKEATPSPEFSSGTSGTPSGAKSTSPTTQTNEKAATSSPEFSEGMRVVTPVGMGTISYIGQVNGQTRYRVRTNTMQKDGTYYATFFAHEMQPIMQASLL